MDGVFDEVENLCEVDTLEDYRRVTETWRGGKAFWRGAYSKRTPDDLSRSKMEKLVANMPKIDVKYMKKDKV